MDWPKRGSQDDCFFNGSDDLPWFIDHLKNVQVGYPQLYWEGSPEYADSLGRNIAKAVAGELTSQQALDEAAEAWIKIVQKLGIEKQKSQYTNFLAGARKLGHQI